MYQVILADPPWSYERSGPEVKGSTPYPTLSVEELSALPIGREAGDPTTGSILLLWATFPKIEDALAVMKAWGYAYKTQWLTWVKLNRKLGTPVLGMGWWTRANAEVILLGVRAPTVGPKLPSVRARLKSPACTNMSSLLMAPRTSHSRKPTEVYDRIDEFFQPWTRKLELFARPPFPPNRGWSYWGNEVPGYPSTFSPNSDGVEETDSKALQ